MTAHSSLAGATRPQPTDFARQKIEDFVRERLMGRKPDGLAFVETLLTIASEVGEVRCSPAGDHGLCFELSGSSPFEVGLDANRGKLRMFCARLAVLCQENGSDFMLYGGEGVIRWTPKADAGQEHISHPVTLKVRWVNTPGQHEFTISAER